MEKLSLTTSIFMQGPLTWVYPFAHSCLHAYHVSLHPAVIHQCVMPNMLPLPNTHLFSSSHANARLAVDLVWFQFMSPCCLAVH
jgi:hypothetical protein